MWECLPIMDKFQVLGDQVKKIGDAWIGILTFCEHPR